MNEQKNISHQLKKQSIFHVNNNDIQTAQQLNDHNQEQNKHLNRFQHWAQTLNSSIEVLGNSVGLLRSNWYDENAKLKAITYGTAFALSKNLVMTCGHNVYSEKHKVQASQIYFFPAINFNKPAAKPLKCTNPRHIRLQTPRPSYAFIPTKEELTIFQLDQEDQLQQDNFFEIGQLEGNRFEQYSLSIIGYPSSNYYRQHEMNDQFYEKIRRTVLEGKVYSINDFTINHTMKTSIGFSGGPIISKNKQGGLQVIGIHTHKGLQSNYNSGLYFNKEILQIFRRFTLQMRIQRPLLKNNDFIRSDTQFFQKQSEKQTMYSQQNSQLIFQNVSGQINFHNWYNSAESINIFWKIQDDQDNFSISSLDQQEEIRQKESDSSFDYDDQNDQSDLEFEQKEYQQQISTDQQSYSNEKYFSKNSCLQQNKYYQYQNSSQQHNDSIIIYLTHREDGSIDIDQRSNQNIFNKNSQLQHDEEQFAQLYRMFSSQQKK